MLKILLAATLVSAIAGIASAQSITVVVNGPLDGKQQSITKTYTLTADQFAGLMDLNRMDFCPKEPVNPAVPNGPVKSTITDAQVIGCFTDYLAIGTMQRITAHSREKARAAAMGEPVPHR